MDQRDAWRQDKTQKGQALLTEITALAGRAAACGFTATAHILKIAASELSKDLDGATTRQPRNPPT
jgi:hypothetical protein